MVVTIVMGLFESLICSTMWLSMSGLKRLTNLRFMPLIIKIKISLWHVVRILLFANRGSQSSNRRSMITHNKRSLTLFSLLYPLGPTDQAIWERAGGDLSRLRLSGQGRTDWYRAIQFIDRGGSVTFDMICNEALLDFPKNRDLEHLRQFLSTRRHSRYAP